MKLYPYAKLKSTNLSLLLFTARCLGMLGILGFCLACFLSCYLYWSSGPKTEVLDNGLTLTASNGYESTAIYLFVYGVLFFIACLVVSGILAALVSIEHKVSSLLYSTAD